MTGYLKTTVAVTALMTIAFTSSSAFAGAFALKERSAKAQGMSFAGVSAGSGGLQSMGFNPAAIGMVEHGFGNLELSGGISLILPSAKGQPSIGGVPFGPSQDPGRLAGVGNSYVGYRLEEDILIGAAIYAPFGLTTQYDAGWLGQFDAITSKLQTIVIAPTVAWEPFPELTLAASANITYVNVRLTSAAANLQGNNTDISFGVGALWDVTPTTRIGLAYQHGYNIDIDGVIEPAVPINATSNLPSTISFGVVQSITDDLRVAGEVQWQNWSVFDRLDITGPGGVLIQSDVQNYDDAFFLAAGAEYDITNALTIRAGAAWDQTPTNSGTPNGLVPAAVNPLATNRTVRVPDEDRLWLSIGASYDMTEHMSIDIGYSYLMTLEDPVVNLRNAPAGSSVTYDGQVHIFSIGGTMKIY